MCKDLATDLDQAKAAFFTHVMMDPAWTKYYSEAQLIDFMDDLE